MNADLPPYVVAALREAEIVCRQIRERGYPARKLEKMLEAIRESFGSMECQCCGSAVDPSNTRPGQVDRVHDAPKGHRCAQPFGCGPVEAKP